jgi:hypothetical protein
MDEYSGAGVIRVMVWPALFLMETLQGINSFVSQFGREQRSFVGTAHMFLLRLVELFFLNIQAASNSSVSVINISLWLFLRLVLRSCSLSIVLSFLDGHVRCRGTLIKRDGHE